MSFADLLKDHLPGDGDGEVSDRSSAGTPKECTETVVDLISPFEQVNPDPDVRAALAKPRQAV